MCPLLFVLTTFEALTTAASPFALSNLRALTAAPPHAHTLDIRTESTLSRATTDDDVAWESMGLISKLHVPDSVHTSHASAHGACLDLRVDDADVEWQMMAFVKAYQVCIPESALFPAPPEHKEACNPMPLDADNVDWAHMGFVKKVCIPESSFASLAQHCAAVIVTPYRAEVTLAGGAGVIKKRVDLTPPGVGGLVHGFLSTKRTGYRRKNRRNANMPALVAAEKKRFGK